MTAQGLFYPLILMVGVIVYCNCKGVIDSMLRNKKKWNRKSLADFIRLKSNEIMSKWETQVLSEVIAAKEQDNIALQNALPQLLKIIANDIQANRISLFREDKSISMHVNHGKQRSSITQYSLSQVIREYSILSKVLVGLAEDEGELSATLRENIIAIIDDAMCQAANSFAEDKKNREHQGRLNAEAERDKIKLAADLLRKELNAVEGISSGLMKERDELHNEIKFIRNKLDSSSEKIIKLTTDADVREHYVAMLAHDLLNPISAVKMAFEILLKELPQRAEIVELANLLLRNLSRVDLMLKDLLDAYRVHAGYRLPLNIARCNLVEIAMRTINDLTIQYGSRFRLVSKKQELIGLWDADRLRRLLENLLTNALKYGDINRSITISLDQDEKFTVIKIHNFGNPISSEDQKILFESFYRAKSANSSKNSGWGLGLVLVKGVVDGHGGDIRVDSSSSEGTTFLVKLPNTPKSV